MIELKDLTVTSAFAIRLGEIFPNSTRYREVVTALAFPHFFILQLTMDTETDNYNRWWANYFYNIRYRYVADPSTQTANLNQQLDGVGLKLLSDLEYIEYEGSKFRVQNARVEKVDNVLHYFCNIKVRVSKPLPEVPLQETLDVNTETQL